MVNDLIERFVDDITVCPAIISPGWKYREDKIIFIESESCKDQLIPDDERTMKVIQSIADSIDPLIKVTYDVPSRYSDLKVPILDIKVGMSDTNEITYEFYKKPISNKYVTHKTSAMSKQQKMHILTQQCFSRLHNTSENVSTDIAIKLLDEFMIELKISGYSETDRKNILEGACEIKRERR